MNNPKPTISQFANIKDLKAELLERQNGLCEWCSDPIETGEPVCIYDGELLHIGCAAECMDNETFDRDMG